MAKRKQDHTQLIYGLLGVALALMLVNQYLLMTVRGTSREGSSEEFSLSSVISTGVPDIYGSELDVSFDRVQESINIMKQFDPTFGKRPIPLDAERAQRYVKIGQLISCEYCCGAKSIVAPNGQAACGCAHSQAMRGLAAYLLQYHSDEYSDDQILRELARWKAMYFPKQMIAKFTQQQESGEYTPDIAALMLEGGVEGSSQSVVLPSQLENLPDMVGGC